MIFGVVLLLVGVIWLLVNLGVIDAAIWTLFWPLLVVYLGVVFLMDDRQNCCFMCKLSDRAGSSVAPKKVVVKKVAPVVVAQTAKVAKKKVTKKSTKSKAKKK